MTPGLAKAILLKAKLLNASVPELSGNIEYVSFAPLKGDDSAHLDGLFSADQLEAIATFMRNPSAVADAQV